MDDLPNRVSALEAWRVTQENWRIAKEQLDDSRHTTTQIQLAALRDGQTETKNHLTRQDTNAVARDTKLDKVVDTTNTILLRLANQDGKTEATLDAAKKDADDQTAARQATANWIAICGIGGSVIVGLIEIFWALHQ